MRPFSWASRPSPSASSPSLRPGHLKKAGVAEFQKVLKEFALEDSENVQRGRQSQG